MKRVVKIGGKYLGLVSKQADALKFNDLNSTRTLLRAIVDGISGQLTHGVDGAARTVRVRPHGTPATPTKDDLVAAKLAAAKDSIAAIIAAL